jgi:hypothetical protein
MKIRHVHVEKELLAATENGVLPHAKTREFLEQLGPHAAMRLVVSLKHLRTNPQLKCYTLHVFS